MAIKITGPIGVGGGGAGVSSVNGQSGVVNLYASDATLNLAGDGIVVNGSGVGSTLDVDSGTTANKIVKLDGSARLPAVDGSQLTNLPSAPVTSVNGATGAVNLYADDATLNLAGDGIVVSGTGATSTLDVDSGTTANKIVKLDGSARLPAVDGSQLTNLPSAPVTSVNGATGAVNIYADDATLNIDGTGLVLSGTGATSTLNVDVGTGANQIVQLDASSRLPAVDGSQLTNLPSAPVTSVNGATGAVNIYADDATLNIDGTGLVLSGTGATSTLNVNVGTGANQIVQLDASSRLPAVDGSQLTNLPSAPVTSVNGATGAVNLYADDATLNLAGDGIVVSGTGATSTLNVDSGTTANKIVKLDGSARLPAVDGSQLTNLPSAPVTSVNGATGAVNIYADDATLNIDGTGLTLSGTGATSTLNVDVGTGANQIVQLDASSRLPAVDGSQLTNLPAAPVTSVNGATGAVNIYADDATLNIDGTGLVLSGTGATSTLNVDVGTGANQIVQLDASSRLPAVDGSQLTNLPSAPVTSVNGATGAVNLYADDATLNLAGDGIVVNGTGATSTLDVDSGTTANKIVKLDGSARLPAVDGSQLTNLPGASRPTVTTDNSGTNSTISNPLAGTLEDIYLVDNGASAVTVTLPTVTSNSGYKVQIKRLGTANVTISPASGTIDGAPSKVLSVQYSAYTLTTDGTNWYII
jgi:L-asparaginase/Glu-tRNA(Gln) amidotransferase subunit D